MQFLKKLFGIESPEPKPNVSKAARAPRPPRSERPRHATRVNAASLRLQLFSADLANFFAETMVMRHLSPHLVAVLVEDLGAAENTVAREHVASLGLDDDALLTLGRMQAAASELAHAKTMEVPVDAGTIEVCVSNQFFLGAFVLTQLEGENQDALVALLTWHHALLHIVTDTTSIETWRAMDELAKKISAEATCTALEWLSPVIHFYRASDRSLTPISPEVFDEYVNRPR